MIDIIIIKECVRFSIDIEIPLTLLRIYTSQQLRYNKRKQMMHLYTSIKTIIHI